MEKWLKHNIGIIVGILGAPLITAIIMILSNSIYACDGSALCHEIRSGIALAVGLAITFIAARIVHRAVTGESLS